MPDEMKIDGFSLDKTLEADTFMVADLPLSTLRLMDDRRYPWLILVPKAPGAQEIFDLSQADQAQLCSETRAVAKAMNDIFRPTKMNVAAIGNVVRQLHVHVIARYEDDDTWPKPVWGLGERLPYPDDHKKGMLERLSSLTNLNLVSLQDLAHQIKRPAD